MKLVLEEFKSTTLCPPCLRSTNCVSWAMLRSALYSSRCALYMCSTTNLTSHYHLDYSWQVLILFEANFLYFLCFHHHPHHIYIYIYTHTHIYMYIYIYVCMYDVIFLYNLYQKECSV